MHLGAIVHVRDRFKRTPLRNALFFGHQRAVQLLLAAGAHLSEWEMKEVTFEVAKWIIAGDVSRVKLLVLAGADLAQPWLDGKRPLDLVCLFMKLQILAIIPNNGYVDRHQEST